MGLIGTLLSVTIATSSTFLKALSVAAIGTDQRVRTGGAYYMVSRSLRVEAGGAIGIPLFIAQALSITFYTVRFAESVVSVFQWHNLPVFFGVACPDFRENLACIIIIPLCDNFRNPRFHVFNLLLFFSSFSQSLQPEDLIIMEGKTLIGIKFALEGENKNKNFYQRFKKKFSFLFVFPVRNI